MDGKEISAIKMFNQNLKTSYTNELEKLKYDLIATHIISLKFKFYEIFFWSGKTFLILDIS